MRRRDFIAALAVAVAGWRGPACGADKPRLIAWLSTVSEAVSVPRQAAFLAGMREHGYAEGTDFRMEYRYADGHYDRLPALAQELMQLDPDLVLGASGTGVLAVKALSKAVPIVSPVLEGEVALGMAASDARPGGNVTGISINLITLDAKRLELARDLLPNAERFGVLVTGAHRDYELTLDPVRTAAAKLGVSIVVVDARVPGDLAPAFAKFTAHQCQAVVVSLASIFSNDLGQLAALAEAARLPDIYGSREAVEAGGLISYGVDLRANFRRAAYFVDRIWKGTPLGELPIEFPTKLELVINQKRANALGITVPQSILVRADDVID
jgi:putative ABC transport system substrate-binding protein